MLIYLQMLPDKETRSQFETLYLRYRFLMFRVARRVLSNDSDAEDAVHQAFLKLIGLMDKIEGTDDKKRPRFWRFFQNEAHWICCESRNAMSPIPWMK